MIAPDVETATNVLNEKLHYLMDKCFPVRRVVMSTRDPPWITPLFKYLLRKTKRAADKGNVDKVEDLSSKVCKLIGENRRNWGKLEHRGVCTGGGESTTLLLGSRNLSHTWKKSFLLILMIILATCAMMRTMLNQCLLK